MYFENREQAAHAFLNFQVTTMTSDDVRPIDWDAFEAFVRPENVPDDEWDAAFARIQLRIGTNWGDYVRTLAEVATLLSGRGHTVFDSRLLFYVVFLQETGHWTSVISGRLMNAQTGQLVAGAPVIARAEAGVATTTIRTALTDQEGRFSILGLPPATYELFVEGYYFNATTTATVTTYTDVTGLMLVANPVPAAPAFQPKHINESDASFALDDGGTPHIVWKHGTEIWHAYFDGASWVAARPDTGRDGRRPQHLRCHQPYRRLGAWNRSYMAAWPGQPVRDLLRYREGQSWRRLRVVAAPSL